MRGKLAPYEYPKDIEFIDALPMTTTGKVQRRVLRELRSDARSARSSAGRLSRERCIGVVGDEHLAAGGRDQFAVLIARFALGHDDAAAVVRLRHQFDVTVHSMVSVSPGRTGARKRALCSR